MKAKLKIFIIVVIVGWATVCVAGVLMQQWTEGTNRYCKYSDGEVLEISYGSTCPSTN
jgi:hypothetical protein